MNIQVSYFASHAPKERKVCIAKWHRNWSGPRASCFAPSNPKAEDWQAAYRRDLDHRFPDATALREALRGVCMHTPDPILCCFESDPSKCHRTILAEYIKEKLGIVVPEWREGSEQATLF